MVDDDVPSNPIPFQTLGKILFNPCHKSTAIVPIHLTPASGPIGTKRGVYDAGQAKWL